MAFAQANQHLASRGVPSSKFEDKGESHTGELIDGDVVPQTDPSGVVKYRKDGVTPIMQLVITWRTEERDPKIPNDKGDRKLYCSWRLEKEIKRAVRAAGADGLEEGGLLKVTFTHEEKIEGVLGKAKIYAAEYTPPTRRIGGTVEADDDGIDESKKKTVRDLAEAGTSNAIISQVTGLSDAQIDSIIGLI